jgi:hypothetical protein
VLRLPDRFAPVLAPAGVSASADLVLVQDLTCKTEQFDSSSHCWCGFVCVEGAF